MALALAQGEPLGPGDHTRTLAVADLKRAYFVHIPKSYDGSKPYPVVLAYHGGASTAEGMTRFSGLSEAADKHGFIVVYPSGTGNLDKALTWNGGNCCGYAMQKQIDDVDFTRAVLDDLARVVKIDPKRVYATGMSNGAIMAYRLASELSDRIAAIAPVAGPMGGPRSAIRSGRSRSFTSTAPRTRSCRSRAAREKGAARALNSTRSITPSAPG